MNNVKSLFCFREGSILLGSRTYIMGIINVTPDSFSDGGDNFLPENAIETAITMEKQGADILDIGGQSTRPGSTLISAEEEWNRLKNILPLILEKTSLPVSVDTFYPEVAQNALRMGCHIINDVSGNVNAQMAEVVKKYNAGWVLMHSGEEKDTDISHCVHNRLENMLNTAISYGIAAENICLDPGIGFGKTYNQNLNLIAETNRVRLEGVAYLLGLSRKSVIGEGSGDSSIPFKDRDFGTVAANTVGILGGADILRVHNVSAAVQSARMTDSLIKRRANNE